MAKKRKNSNYVTEKTIRAKAQKEEALRKEQIKKTIKAVAIPVIAVLLIVGAVLGIGAAFGMFDYNPTVTNHAIITIEDYGTLHIELYGKDAPETVKHFIELVEDGDYNNTFFHTLIDGVLYGGAAEADGGSKGIEGEFHDNGFINKVKHTRGTLSMARGEDYDSAYGQFFITTKKSPELDRFYAAFGKVTDGMEYIDQILKDVQPDANGNIPESSRPVITSITLHDSHGH